MFTTRPPSARWSSSARSRRRDEAGPSTFPISPAAAGARRRRSASSTRDRDTVGELAAIVLARGLGRRMREAMTGAEVELTPDQDRAADAGFKSLMPMPTAGGAGRPFLDYLLAGLADVGIEDVG